MQLGLRTVTWFSDGFGENVAWAWVVIVFSSVIASTLSAIVAMVVGFEGLLLVGLAACAVALLAIRRLAEPRGSRA